jgi:acyl dehydratase
MPRTFSSTDELASSVGADLGTTDWITVTQEQVDKFADATLDHQWIHTDSERARNGPFGAPIAHGYLTLSLASHFLSDLAKVEGISMGINYGVDKVRFPSPVPVGSRLRGHGQVVEVKDVPGGVQAVVRVTIERDGADKPAAIVDTVSRYIN